MFAIIGLTISFSLAVTSLLLISSVSTAQQPVTVSMDQENQLEVMRKPCDTFTLDFINKLSNNLDENIFFSPLGIIVLFGMLLEGAKGQTKDQIIEVLRLKSSFNDSQAIRSAFSQLIENYNQKDENFTLLMGNKAVINKKFQLNSEFAKVLSDHYRSSADSEDFNAGQALVQKLNLWVANMTNNLIPNLFQDPPESETVMILINTLYFKGKWTTPFRPSETRDETFNNIDGSTSTVKMMQLRNKKFPYLRSQDDQLKIIELPYHGNVSMFILMPAEPAGLRGLATSLTEAKLNSYINMMSQRSLGRIEIPKFNMKDSHALHEILPSLGLELPFGDSANLSGIANVDLKVSKAVQEAVLIVDEEGSEAAAATFAFTVMRMSVSGPKEEFVLDRPFMFFLRDTRHSINLFAGVVNKLPSFSEQDVDSTTITPDLTSTLPTTISE